LNAILLDTHFLYWWMTADPNLGVAEELIATAAVSVSAASQWELVLKNDAGKLPLPNGPIAAAIVREGFELIPVRPTHVDAVRALPPGLIDPFDRLLLATAIVENLPLLTRDKAILAFASKLGSTVVRRG
jgi:PIN domain nuclease of toxin-antitoxin system